ncbi:hypothetical protein B0T09DRAFT_340934 [Sordaria sp. MPI-SDFR-AT-0083]|nr:hypothetical protein B0T09DRAFT_340934 [Sordaria sp. MPI-SDFR-AT-0083]
MIVISSLLLLNWFMLLMIPHLGKTRRCGKSHCIKFPSRYSRNVPSPVVQLETNARIPAVAGFVYSQATTYWPVQ